MKILLIQAPWYGFQNIISDRLYLGLAYLAAVLDKDGHQVQIFNGETFFKNIINQREKVVINEEDYLKNFNSNHEVYKEIMKAVKKFWTRYSWNFLYDRQLRFRILFGRNAKKL